KYTLEHINDFEGYRYFVRVERATGEDAQRVQEEMPDADDLILPRRSMDQVNEETKRLKAEAETLTKELHRIAACCTGLLKGYANEIQQQLSEQNALLQTSEEVEGTIRL